MLTSHRDRFRKLDSFATSHPFEGQRFDYFFNGNGDLIAGPIPMTFSVDQHALRAPRFLNWSLALEHKLPSAIYMKMEFLRRHGTHGFAYNRPPGAPALSGNYILENTREDLGPRFPSLRPGLPGN